MGKTLGSGAGGTVRICYHPSSSKSSSSYTNHHHPSNLKPQELKPKKFAVKQFREIQTGESRKSYLKKITAEFCIGSALHHPNIIKTLEIIEERGKFYEVMEYAQHDLFTILGSGKMNKSEKMCWIKQILKGVDYLHSIGLAHRDLKLENVVIDEEQTVKLIDFGTASVFSYQPQREDGGEVLMSSGLVGSDPYLAPEIIRSERTQEAYDPRLGDLWAIGIIWLCLEFHQFPWKIARGTVDESFRTYELSNGERLAQVEPQEAHRLVKKLISLKPKERGKVGEVLEDRWLSRFQDCSNGHRDHQHLHLPSS